MDSDKPIVLLKFAGLRIDSKNASLIGADGMIISLRRKSLAVFEYLAGQHSRLVSKQEIFEAVWGAEPVSDDSLNQCLADIRRAMGTRGHKVLRTVPRKGYILTPDGERQAVERTPRLTRARWIAAVAVVLFGIGVTWLSATRDRQGSGSSASTEFGEQAAKSAQAEQAEQQAQLKDLSKTDQNALSARVAEPFDTEPPSLAIAVSDDGSDPALTSRFVGRLRAKFARYKTVRLAAANDAAPDLELSVRLAPGADGARRLFVAAIDAANGGKVFSTRAYDISAGQTVADSVIDNLAIRTAAFASPAGGEFARHLMATAIHKPVAKLSAAECYAHAYDCTTCAGEMDHVSERAVECLDRLLTANPRNTTAMALKAAVHAHQYRWGSAVPEPERTDLQARRYRATLAVQTAERAAAMSDGTDPVVYWGLAQGYMATCNIDKLQSAVTQGLALNPDDPGMLAVFGNWLSYAGLWDEGRAMVERALEIEPVNYRRWWLMAPAKWHYNRGEYEQAYEWFQGSFNERNWVSHLQLAYTLPHLGRLDEAKKTVKEAMRWYPGVTLEKALQFYEVGCFSEEFRTRIRDTLIQAGMPSRGSSVDIQRVRQVPAKLIKVNGLDLEVMDIGEGEPIVFVHGAFADYRAWGSYETRISEKHRFISYTQRWHGNRPWPEPYVEPTVQTFADDLIGLIKALNVGPVHLVSWSMGGPIAIAAQLQRPDLVKSAVHYEAGISAVSDDVGRFTKVRKKVFKRVPEIKKLFIDGDMNGAVMGVWEVVAERKRGAFNELPPLYKRGFYDNARSLRFVPLKRDELTCQRIGENRVATLLLHGGQTHAWGRHLNERLAQCMPNSELTVIQDQNHMAPIFGPEKLSQLIIEHVRQHAGQR